MGQALAPIAERGWMLPGIVVAALFALYALAIDQGLLLSVVQGNVAFDQNLVHELVHDARHAAGFPCH